MPHGEVMRHLDRDGVLLAAGEFEVPSDLEIDGPGPIPTDHVHERRMRLGRVQMFGRGLLLIAVQGEAAIL